MPFFRKKPVVVEAHRFGGSTTDRIALQTWIKGGKYVKPHVTTRDYCRMSITTLEGVMEAEPGDWIIKGTAGEFYPCKPEIFKNCYEQVDGDSACLENNNTGSN